MEKATAKPTTEELLAATLAQLVELQKGSNDVQKAQLKQTAPKSNQHGPNRSVYNPRGEKDFPMPLLKCEVYCPWKESPTYHHLDREEVELFNLLEPGEYPVELVDGSVITAVVVGVRNHETGKLEKMTLAGPKDPDTGHYSGLFTADRRNSFPSLKSMLRQMVGEPATAVMTMKKEIELIKSGQLAVSVGE